MNLFPENLAQQSTFSLRIRIITVNWKLKIPNSFLKSPNFQYRSTQAASMYWLQLIMMLIPFQLVSSVEKSFLLLVNLE